MSTKFECNGYIVDALAINERIFYIGNIRHCDVINLIRYSELCINPSSNEGLPRFCLESIAMGAKVALPMNVNEFVKHCPNFILKGNSIEELTRNLQRIYTKPLKSEYPIGNHYPEKVIKLYSSILEKS